MSCTLSSASAGSPVPPRDSQVSCENWYLPRYSPLGDTAAGLPPDSQSAILASTVATSAFVIAFVEALVVEPARPSAASVAGPATPSAVSPCAFWKRLSARRVFGPITPSALMPSAFWICRVVTFFAAGALCAAVVPPELPSAANAGGATVPSAANASTSAAPRRTEGKNNTSSCGTSVGSLGLTAPTGLADGLARRPALRRRHDGDSPREPDHGSIGSPVPRR